MTQSCPVSLVWAKCVIRVPDHKYRSSLTTDSDGLRRRWLKKMMLMMKRVFLCKRKSNARGCMAVLLWQRKTGLNLNSLN